MTMQRSAEGLRGLGYHDLALRQKEIQAELQRRNPGMEDFPLIGRLPEEQGSRLEAISIPLSPETLRLVERMRGDGYAVYNTTGRTPESLRKDGMLYWFLNDKLAELTSPPALLAFKKAPSEFFLRGSQDIPHDEQVKLIPAEQASLDARYPDAGLVVDEGELPEWTELALKHFKATGVRILGKDFGYARTWTKTYETDQPRARRAYFGYWDGSDGARAALWAPGNVSPRLGLALLVRIPLK